MTEEQKKIINSEEYWKEVEEKKRYIAQSKPVTWEEARAQQIRLDKELGIKNDFLDYYSSTPSKTKHG